MGWVSGNFGLFMTRRGGGIRKWGDGGLGILILMNKSGVQHNMIYYDGRGKV